ncbi:class I SAM-dependent methyltransferase [uncultured Maribacter sp.]|uniref:THUMP-like domain-containing protein n=1 Tax=uncultured Maribacter sp. TaxID=431308 RepID=UPI00262E817D|nr:class I SAM-dependent methyltransferase [uncultured Maribacter sp.]
MNKEILSTGVQIFINNNINTDTMSVLLKKSPFTGVTSKELVEQIEAKKKCQKKLPKWFNTPNIYFPNKLNIEQTSSEKTAEYKASILTKKTVIDITGGFGIDCYYFSKKMKEVFHCEINEKLATIAAHNFKELGTKNIQSFPIDGIKYLKESNHFYDWIYIDPSRRNDAKGKVFLLADCLPNVPENLKLLFNKSNNIAIKTSPLLDISIGISELKQVKEIHVVSLENEVKELIWILEKDYKDNIEIKTINIGKQKTDTFSFNFYEEKEAKTTYNLPKQFLYEPNAAILKSGAFKILGEKLNLSKLQVNSHLYTSEQEVLNFPGRIFKIEKSIPYNKKFLRELKISKANITTRNFPESVANLRKKLKIKDGGDVYLFFTTTMNNDLTVFICSKHN